MTIPTSDDIVCGREVVVQPHFSLHFMWGYAMKRINLSLRDELYRAIKATADERNTTPNLLMIGILENAFSEQLDPFDYSAALSQLIKEAQEREPGPFTLADLPSFSDLCISTASSGYLQPSTLRARLGKAFNAAVRTGSIMGVSRAKFVRNGVEKNQFRAGTAVFIKSNE